MQGQSKSLFSLVYFQTFLEMQLKMSLFHDFESIENDINRVLPPFSTNVKGTWSLKMFPLAPASSCDLILDKVLE